MSDKLGCSTIDTATGSAEAGCEPEAPNVAPVPADPDSQARLDVPIDAEPPIAEPAASKPRLSRGVRVFAAFAVVFIAGYAGFERIGTTANVDLIETYKRYAGGFLGIGFTDTQPGVLVLSKIEKDAMSLEAVGRSNRLTGRSTRVKIDINGRHWSKRLRGPQIVMISADGRIDAAPLDWSLDEFRRAGVAVDCSDTSTGQKACGMPFIDFQEFAQQLTLPRLPKIARDFLVTAKSELQLP